MFNSIAKVKYDSENDILRAELFDDLVNYYKFLYLKDSWNINKMWTARYGPHISIYSPRHYPDILGDKSQYNNLIIQFQYNPEHIFRGGQNSGHIGYYLPIISKDLDKIKQQLKIVDNVHFRGLHVSLFTNKHLTRQN